MYSIFNKSNIALQIIINIISTCMRGTPVMLNSSGVKKIGLDRGEKNEPPNDRPYIGGE